MSSKSGSIQLLTVEVYNFDPTIYRDRVNKILEIVNSLDESVRQVIIPFD